MDRFDMMWAIGIMVALAGTGGCGGGSGERAALSRTAASAPAVAETARAAVAPCAQTQDVTAPVIALGSHDMTWKDDTGHGNGPDPHVVLALPAGHVCAIRVSFTITTTDGRPAYFQVFWKRRGGEYNEKDQEAGAVASSAQPQTFTVKVDADIDGLRIDPDARPVTFKLSGIVLATPAGAAPR